MNLIYLLNIPSRNYQLSIERRLAAKYVQYKGALSDDGMPVKSPNIKPRHQSEYKALRAIKIDEEMTKTVQRKCAREMPPSFQ